MQLFIFIIQHLLKLIKLFYIVLNKLLPFFYWKLTPDRATNNQKVHRNILVQRTVFFVSNDNYSLIQDYLSFKEAETTSYSNSITII